MGIREDAAAILQLIGSHSKTPDDPQRGRHALEGEDIAAVLPASPERINEAVSFLETSGLARVIHSGTVNPYDFILAELTPRGRLEFERLESEVAPETTAGRNSRRQARPTPLTATPLPVGSPYGFTEQDWAQVAVDKRDRQRLVVCLGFAWASSHYDPSELETNLRASFESAVRKVAERRGERMHLDFRKLQGAYGAHLFNLIARDIIAADIAVFDTSDLNPNVMIELGVALTWGTPLLPIRARGSTTPPSDVSGQTWVEYVDSGAQWPDPHHDHKLEALLSAAIDRKRGFAA